jgi:mRNA interferase HicA
VKRRDLVARLQSAAKAAGLEWTFVRQGAAHEVWSINGKNVTIPRHTEINELTARGILKNFEDELGKDWWR